MARPTTRTDTRLAFKRPPILCADDEPDVLKFLQFTFEDVGYKVILASDHDVALEAASLCQPDLICLDLCMPEKDGFAVLGALRNDPALAQVPVVVLSISREEARALAAGARCYLAKPVDSEDLVAAVRDLLALESGSVLIVEDDPDRALYHSKRRGRNRVSHHDECKCAAAQCPGLAGNGDVEASVSFKG